MTSQVNVGVRHVMVVPLFLAGTAGAAWQGSSKFRPWAVGALLAALTVSSWLAHPSYIPYANEALGRPTPGTCSATPTSTGGKTSSG